MSTKEENNIISKYEKTINAVCAIISAIVIGGTGIFVSIYANSISKQQMEITKMNTNPYFEVAMNKDEQSGYIIYNEGGYIQNATVTLKSFINVDVRNHGSKIFCFPYQVLVKHYDNLKNNDLVVDFENSHFGINDWDLYNQGLSDSMEKKFKKDNIMAIINYLEYMEIEYIDFNRIAHKEIYSIGYKDNEGLFLLPMPSASEEVIRLENPDGVFLKDFHFGDKDNTIRQIGNTQGVGGRGGNDVQAVFIADMVSKINEYIK